MNNEIQIIWKDLCQELKAFIKSKVKDEELTKDILQDTFLKAHLNIHQLKNTSKLTSWIYQITRNLIHDHFRNQRPLVPLENMAEVAIEKEPSFQNLTNCINTKIEQLPPKYKEAVVLTTFQQLKQTELAAYLGISYSGAKSRVQRSKEQLENLVKTCDNVETDSQDNIIEHNLD